MKNLHLLGSLNITYGSVSFGPRPGGGLYSQDGINEAGLSEDLRQQHDYRSLPHKNNRGYPNSFSNNIQYPNYNSTASTPRRPPQPQPRAQRHYDRESLMEAEFSGASDNRSENTVIEQQDRSFSASISASMGERVGRRASNSRSIVSNVSNNCIQSGDPSDHPDQHSDHSRQPGYLVVQGVGGPIAHSIGMEEEDVDEDLIMEDEGPGGPLSSEDNLSHDSYELIERAHSSVVDLNKPPPSSANQFEQEFYRQAAASASKNGLDSSRTSSHCSLTMSPQVIKGKENGNDSEADHIIAVTASNTAANAVVNTAVTSAMSRVKSADSFSQASNHSNVSGNNLNKIVEKDEPATIVVSQDPPETSFTSRGQMARQDIIRGRGRGRGGQMSDGQQPQTYVEVIDADGQSAYLAPQFAHLMHQQQRIPDYTHSLPRANAEGYIIYHHPQQGILRGIVPHNNVTTAATSGAFSRTLPNRRRERSPVYYSRSRLAPGGHAHQDCSSGSSSSHASPLIARPKSLEFAVVNVNALPNKQAYSYHDDSIEQGHQQSANQLISNQLMKPPLDLYDDSSSAMNEQLSSSDVPQTPENPNVTFLPLEAGPVIVGCHQGVVAGLKQYYNTEERIYDVPEGIEGITAPIKIRKSLALATTHLAPEVITSPSSSSGITEPFVPPQTIKKYGV